MDESPNESNQHALVHTHALSPVGNTQVNLIDPLSPVGHTQVNLEHTSYRWDKDNRQLKKIIELLC